MNCVFPTYWLYYVFQNDISWSKNTFIEFDNYCFFASLCFNKNRGSNHRCSVKMVFWKISQFHRKNTCVEAFLKKIADLKVYNIIKIKTLPLLFSWENRKIFNRFLFGTTLVAASENGWRISEGRSPANLNRATDTIRCRMAFFNSIKGERNVPFT